MLEEPPMGIGNLRKLLARVVGKFAAALNWCVTRPGYRRFVALTTDLFRALWICRISFTSIALGILVFSIAPQSRDIFLEIAGHLGTKEGSWAKDLSLDNSLRSACSAIPSAGPAIAPSAATATPRCPSHALPSLLVLVPPCAAWI